MSRSLSQPDLLKVIQDLTNRLDVLEKLLIPVESWNEVGTDGAPLFLNSWVNYNSSYSTAAYYKDPLSVVHIKGFVKNGTLAQPVFQLPIGYRPIKDLYIAVLGEPQDIAYANIKASTGYVYAVNPSGLNGYFSLDNIAFRAEQ